VDVKQLADEGGEGIVVGITTVWVLASGPVLDAVASVGWLPQPAKVVAADGGTSLAAELGLVPDLVIGDMDSSSPAQVQKLKARGVELRLFDHYSKWETDTELAVMAALQWSPKRIIVLGATGGRLDHTVANLLLLTHPRLVTEDVRIVEGQQEVFLAKPGCWNRIEGGIGATVSVLPVSEEVNGVRNQGLEYPLGGETMVRGSGRGVSNQIVAPDAAIWVDSGLLYVIVWHVAPREEE
jgi:thiamine pyrophosphokinase